MKHLKQFEFNWIINIKQVPDSWFEKLIVSKNNFHLNKKFKAYISMRLFPIATERRLMKFQKMLKEIIY